MDGLPEPFRDLSGGIEWALPTERQRFNKRLGNTQKALQAYYDLLAPRMSAVMDYLGQFDSRDALAVETLNLYYMALAWMEVSNSVERFHEPDESGVFAAERYHVKGPEDLIVGYRPT